MQIETGNVMNRMREIRVADLKAVFNFLMLTDPVAVPKAIK
jgi:hypothetical protein